MTALLKRSSRNLDNDRKDNSKIPKSMKYKSQNRYVQNGHTDVPVLIVELLRFSQST